MTLYLELNVGKYQRPFSPLAFLKEHQTELGCSEAEALDSLRATLADIHKEYDARQEQFRQDVSGLAEGKLPSGRVTDARGLEAVRHAAAGYEAVEPTPPAKKGKKS